MGSGFWRGRSWGKRTEVAFSRCLCLRSMRRDCAKFCVTYVAPRGLHINVGFDVKQIVRRCVEAVAIGCSSKAYGGVCCGSLIYVSRALPEGFSMSS